MSFANYTGLRPQVIKCTEGTGQTFGVGDLVVSDSSGEMVVATAGNIFGIARQAAVGTETTVMDVELINGYDIYAVPLNTTTAQTNVGAFVAITFTAGGQYVTVGTGTKEAYIVGLHPADAIGTSGGRVLVRFNMGALEPR